MGKTKIHMVVECEGEVMFKSVDTLDEMDATIKKIKEGYEAFDPEKDMHIFVGEKRCIKVQNQRASVRYRLTNVGCNCD